MYKAICPSQWLLNTDKMSFHHWKNWNQRLYELKALFLAKKIACLNAIQKKNSDKLRILHISLAFCKFLNEFVEEKKVKKNRRLKKQPNYNLSEITDRSVQYNKKNIGSNELPCCRPCFSPKGVYLTHNFTPADWGTNQESLRGPLTPDKLCGSQAGRRKIASCNSNYRATA